MKNVLITGAAGLVGRNLLLSLSQYSNLYKIRISVHKAWVEPDVGIVWEGDLRDADYCARITKDVDIVFHCAAASFGAAIMSSDPAALVTPNVIMNAQLLDAAHKNGVKKFVWLASTTGYPDLPGVDTKEDQMFVGDPHDKYFGVGWGKRYTEKLCEFYATKVAKPMQCIVLRPTNIYGPYDKYDFDKCHVLPALIRRFAEKQNPLDVWGDGLETRDFIYVDDMVEAIVDSIQIGVPFFQANIGSGTQFSINDVIELLSHVTGHYPEINRIQGKPSMIASRRVDVSKAKKAYGFEATTTLKKGLTDTIEWYHREKIECTQQQKK